MLLAAVWFRHMRQRQMHMKGLLSKEGRRLKRLKELVGDNSGKRWKWSEARVLWSQCLGRMKDSMKVWTRNRRFRYKDINIWVVATQIAMVITQRLLFGENCLILYPIAQPYDIICCFHWSDSREA